MSKISMNLSTESINKAIHDLKVYKQSLANKAAEIAEKLADYGANVCRATIVEMNIPDTGNLFSRVSSYYSPMLNAGFVTVDCDYAVFVEFGTGVKGANASYIGQAMAECGYRYMSGTHYVTTQDGRLGWYYPADDGTWKFTQGMPSRPFMYETGMEMRDALNQIIKEVFKK